MHLSLARGSDFQEVRLTPSGKPRILGDPGHIQLRGPVRQVVTRTVQEECKALRHHLPLLTDLQLDPDPLHPLVSCTGCPL